MSVIRQRILENMQKFSRAMIGAVLFLPVIGLILALSSVLTNPTLIAETSFLHQLGQLLGDTFWPLFGNLGLLFCVGISYGLAKDKKTEVALVSVMCFIMFLGANHSWLEHTHAVAEKINGEYYGTGQTQLLGFVVVDMGVFLGIILGCTIAWVHNKVSNIELPGALSMYGGAKLTLVAMTPVIICYAIAFTWIWPFMTHGISALTGFMKNAGVAGVFVYGFFEKFLIPTGLHHFVWSPFQLTQIGGTLNVDGQVVSGTQAIFLAYMRHPDLTPVMNDALRFSQQGMTTIFGLAGASLAFYHTAKPEKKAMAKAILQSKELPWPMEIGSRGLVVLFPQPVNQKVEAVLARNGLSAKDHTTTPLTAEDINDDTLLLVMEDSQREKIREDFPDAPHLQTIAGFLRLAGDIPALYGEPLTEYGKCYEALEFLIEGVLARLKEEEEQ